jgi:hypothetical protein
MGDITPFLVEVSIVQSGNEMMDHTRKSEQTGLLSCAFSSYHECEKRHEGRNKY